MVISPLSLVLWFSALGLMMWRWPLGDRFHKPACIIGGGIWLLLPLLEPSMRSVPYAAACLVLLALALFRGLTDAITAKLLRARHSPF